MLKHEGRSGSRAAVPPLYRFHHLGIVTLTCGAQAPPPPRLPSRAAALRRKPPSDLLLRGMHEKAGTPARPTFLSAFDPNPMLARPSTKGEVLTTTFR